MYRLFLTFTVAICAFTVAAQGIDEDKIESFCNIVDSGNFTDTKKEFYLLVTGEENKTPTRSEVQAFWQINKESMICPDPYDLGDEENFLKRATNAMNLDFIRLLARTDQGGFACDMNFSIVDPDSGENFTIVDLVGLKKEKLQSDLLAARAVLNPDQVVTDDLNRDIHSLESLVSLLRSSGALSQSEMESN